MIMKIHHFTINNFRKFKRQSFIFHPNFTVLIGRNATGKTQILDAISIVLGVYITKIFRKDKTIRSIAQEEIRVEQHVYIDDNGNKQVREEIQYPVSLSAEIDYHGNHYQQVCAKENSQGRTTFGRTSAFSKKATEDSKQIIHGEYLDLPFLAYYGSGRLWSLKKHFSNNSSGGLQSIGGIIARQMKAVLPYHFDEFPPDENEVRRYITEKDMKIDVDRFYDHYYKTGWCQQNGKHLDGWHFALCHCEKKGEWL